MRIFKRVALYILLVALCITLTLSTFTVAHGSSFAYGIDVSFWQGDVDWEKVAASGVDYVILRVGTGNGKDTRFEENYIAAKDAGLDVGCYYYTYATSIEAAEADAKNVLSWIEGKQLEYPVYYDIESNDSTLSATEYATEMCLTFLDMMHQNGWYAGIYCNEDWLVNYLDRELLEETTEIWYARWTSSGQPDGDYSQYGMWQYSQRGRCAGIYGDVDLDICYKDYPSIIKRGGYNGFPKEDKGLIPTEESGLYIKDGYLFGTAAEMTAEEFLQKAGFPCEVTLLTHDGEALTGDAFVTTGTIVSRNDAEEMCILVIKGDTDGNGRITSADFMQVRRSFLRMYELSGEYALAADTNGDGSIGSTDFMQIRRHFLGIFDIYA